VIVSHTAMAAIFPSKRNLTDWQVRAIAERGGIVGVMAQSQFLGGRASRISRTTSHMRSTWQGPNMLR